MSVRLNEEVRRAVADCILKGTMLNVPRQARRISKLLHIDMHLAAQDLVYAGIHARVNIEFGSAAKQD